MSIDVLDGIREEEYTGENRCNPCTVLNVIIAGVLGLAISLKSKRSGIIVFSLSVIIIYLRGYLVPGTPSLTKQYLPARVLRWFGKEPKPNLDTGLSTDYTDSTDDTITEDTRTGQETDTQSELNVEQYLLTQNIVEPCEEIDDLCLTSEFETAWLEEIDQINTENITADEAASLISNGANEELEIVEYGDARVLTIGDTEVGKWPSHAALIADVTAARVIEKRDQHWNQYKPEKKGELLMSVRLFLETCPTNKGSISMNEETVESCCQSYNIIAVTCDETGERLFEHPIE